MSETQDEENRETYRSYPHQQPAMPEIVPAEPTNAELADSRGAPPTGTNWAVLLRILAVLILIVLLVFWAFPLDTWEFQVGP